MKKEKLFVWIPLLVLLAMTLGIPLVQREFGQPWSGVMAFVTYGGYLLFALLRRKKQRAAQEDPELTEEVEGDAAAAPDGVKGGTALPFLLVHHAFNARYYQVFRSAEAYRFVHVGNEFKGIDPDRMLEKCPGAMQMRELKKSFSIPKADVQRFTLKIKKSTAAAPLPTSGVVTFYAPKKMRYDLLFDVTAKQAEEFFCDLRNRTEKKEKAYHRQKNRSDKNQSLGRWRRENQKPGMMKVLTRLTKVLTVAGAALSLAFLFLPVPYKLTAWALLVLLTLALFLPIIFPAYYSLTRTTEEAKREEGANAIGWFSSTMACGIGLTLRSLMDFNFHYDWPLLAGVVLGVVLTLAYAIRCRELHRRVGWIFGILFMVTLFVEGMPLELNYLLDTSETVMEERVVLDKHISTSSKGPDSYYCTVELQGKEVDIDVGKEAYTTIEVGDTVEICTRKGAFGMVYSQILTED